MEFEIAALGLVVTILGLVGTMTWKLSASISRLATVTKLLRDDVKFLSTRLDTHLEQHRGVAGCPVAKAQDGSCPMQPSG